MKRLAVVLLPLLALACGPTSTSIRTGNTLPAKPADCDVQVFLTGEPKVPYDEIGQVEAQGTSDFAQLIPLLRKEACALGADALIGFKNAAGEGYTATASGQTATGTSYSKYYTVAVAVKLKP